jgi:hypothetical protein
LFDKRWKNASIAGFIERNYYSFTFLNLFLKDTVVIVIGRAPLSRVFCADCVQQAYSIDHRLPAISQRGTTLTNA